MQANLEASRSAFGFIKADDISITVTQLKILRNPVKSRTVSLQSLY